VVTCPFEVIFAISISYPSLLINEILTFLTFVVYSNWTKISTVRSSAFPILGVSIVFMGSLVCLWQNKHGQRGVE